MPTIPSQQACSLHELLALNPGLTLADILALWRWVGPSTRVQ